MFITRMREQAQEDKSTKELLRKAKKRLSVIKQTIQFSSLSLYEVKANILMTVHYENWLIVN